MRTQRNTLHIKSGAVIITAIFAAAMIYVSAACSDTNDDPATPSCTVNVAKPEQPSTALDHINVCTFTTVSSWQPDPADVEACAKMLYRECRGVESTTEQAATLWCVLNRVDSDAYPDTLIDVLRQPAQFAYDYDTPVCDELRELAEDVLTRHHREQLGEENVGRVLPREYLYFVGDGQRNHFMREWKSGEYWTWELESPYED